MSKSIGKGIGANVFHKKIDLGTGKVLRFEAEHKYIIILFDNEKRFRFPDSFLGDNAALETHDSNLLQYIKDIQKANRCTICGRYEEPLRILGKHRICSSCLSNLVQCKSCNKYISITHARKMSSDVYYCKACHKKWLKDKLERRQREIPNDKELPEDAIVVQYTECDTGNQFYGIIVFNQDDYWKNKSLIYSSTDAKELLTAVFWKDRNGMAKIDGIDYQVRLITENMHNTFFTDSIIVRNGGGIANGIDGCELQDVFVYSEKTERYELMATSYDPKRKLNYIGKMKLKNYIEKNGRPIGIRFRYFSARSQTSFNFNGLSEESLLLEMGYNVGEANGLSEYERQTLLAMLIDCNILNEARIINHLEFLIRIHESDPRYRNAIPKWRTDIAFVAEYRYDPERYTIYKGNEQSNRG